MPKNTASNTKSTTLAGFGGRLSRRGWFLLGCLLVILLIIWFGHRPIFGMLGYVPSSSLRTVGSTTENFATGETTKSTPTISTGTDTGATVNGSTSSDRSSTNTNTTTNTRTTERTTTGSPTSGTPTPAPSPAPSQPTQDRMPLLYASINGGQSKQQLISLAGSNPDKCTQVDLDGLGQQEVCSWTNNNEAVTATLLNNQVTAKTKVGF